MIHRRMMTSATLALAVAVAGVGLAAGTAQAAGPFDACTDVQWNAFAAAVDANDPTALAAFLDTIGANCPLQATAELLICQLEPATCLQTIEPAAPPPTPTEIPEEDEPYSYFSFDRAPGEHIGIENDTDRGDSGNDDGGNEPGPSTDTGPSDTGPSDDRGDDKPTSEPTDTCCSISAAL